MLTKFICIAKIHLNQSINYLLMEEEKIKHDAFIDYSQTIDDVYENLGDYNPTKNTKALKVFDDMVADKEANTLLKPIVAALLLRGRTFSVSNVF